MKRLETISYKQVTTSLEDMVRKGWRINKHADPTERALFGITVDEAEDIIAEDPGLIWLERDCTTVAVWS